MGARGPAPKPTPLRVIQGDRKDRINNNEPVPSTTEVKCPTHLSKEAKKLWAFYAPDLIRKKVLTAWDVDAFATYCDATARHWEATKALAEQDPVVEEPIVNREGEIVGYRIKKNPWQMVWRETADIMQRFGARFGLTPSDRSQLKVDHGDGSSPEGRLLT